MNKKKNNKKKINTGRKGWIVGGISLGALILISAGLVWGLSHKGQAKQVPGITEQIDSYTGFSRTVSQEEYDFFCKSAEKEVTDRTDENLVQEKGEELLRLESAQFYLGNKLGVCAPYSFEQMKLWLQEENASRKAKKEKSEPIYGPSQYTLEGYFEYRSSMLRVDIIEYLSEHADQFLTDKAEAYYEMNKDDFKTIEEIKYSLTEQGDEMEYTIAWDDLKELEKKDYQLAEFLMDAKEGEELSYVGELSEVTAKILSVTEKQEDFNTSRTSIIASYLEAEYYDELLQEVAQNNPVVMEREK